MSAREVKQVNWLVISRSLRIITGLVLLAYVMSHLLNMALGLHTIKLADQARPYLTGLWVGFIGSKILLFSITIHFFLALRAIYFRETLRLQSYDAVQLISSGLIIPLLAPHVLGSIGAQQIGMVPSYNLILKQFWVYDPVAGLRQVLLIGVIWVHGCIGFFTWLRTKDRAGPALLWLYPLAVAIPVLALLGYVEGGREVLQSVATGETQSLTITDIEKIAYYRNISRWIVYVSIGLMVLTLIARSFRVSRQPNGIVAVEYDTDNVIIEAQAGLNLLDIVQLNDLPHANICRGRGRCGTCRIRIVSSEADLPSPSLLEQDTLSRFDSGSDVRLACQFKPLPGKLKIKRLVSPDYDPHQEYLVKSDTAEIS